jgi:hypothetical protein
MTNYFYNAFGECNYNSNIELLTNTNYTAMNFRQKIKLNTDILINGKQDSIKGYLKDCKDHCDKNKDCIGFSRDAYLLDNYPMQCYFKKNFDICDQTNFVINDEDYNTYINDKGMKIIQNNLIKLSYTYNDISNPLKGISSKINEPIQYKLVTINTCGLLNTINCEITSSEIQIPPAIGKHGSLARIVINRPNNINPIWSTGNFYCVDVNGNPKRQTFNKLPNSIVLQKGDQINLILTGMLPGYIAQISYINIELNKDISKSSNVF